MGNLFIGFPVPRAKIATMIEEAAPPLNHVDNHLPDGTDPIVDPGDIEDDQNLTWNGTKFVGTDPPAGAPSPSPISVHGCDFLAVNSSENYACDRLGLRRLDSLNQGEFHGPVFFPHGVTVTKFTVYAYRDTPGSSIITYLSRISNTGAIQTLATVTADWTDGYGSLYDDSISYEVIDNNTYSYLLRCMISPDIDVQNVKFMRAQIDFT